MASSVFFKFKSSKEPQRVTFDGTGISVFELKREIININHLGDGTDFDLAIYAEDTNEEYDDDTTIIPRSSSVIARRLPAARPGYGKAARYVTGKMPVTAKNAYRTETSQSKPAVQGAGTPIANGVGGMDKAQTEEERIAAMFKAEGENWEQQKQQMANQKPVFTGRKPMNVPDHDPPPGYVCHRCYQKGHWIQACPTNDDPTYDNRPKVKRTTGIPKSFLKEVEPQAQHVEAGLDDEKRQPSGVMYDNGKQVVYVPDQASWEKFQAKAQASAAQQEAVATGSKELQERGLECPIDKRMFVDPVKTPCCGKTYCHDCIENALVNSDLVCPNCSTEGVLIDDLVSDEETIAKMKAYEEEKAAARKAKEQSKSPKPENADTADIKQEKSGDADRKSKSPTPSKADTNTPPNAAAIPATNGSSKKRPAEEELKNDRIPTAPAAMRKQSQQPTQQAPNGFDQAFINQMNALAPPLAGPNQPLVNGHFMPFPGMNGVGFPNQNMMGMPMMPMANGMMNPMMMQGGGAGWQGMGGMGGMGIMGYGQQPNGVYGNFNNGMMPNGTYGHQNWHGNQGWGMNGMPQQPINMMNGKTGVFPNQQRTVFSEPFPNDEDSAYFRKPVNPHRHQNRQRRARQADYTEL